MVSFLNKQGNTAMIRIVCGKESKMNAALYGGDNLILDNILNEVNEDDNIKHVKLSVAYYDNENDVLNKIKGDVGNRLDKNQSNHDEDDSEDSNNESEHKDSKRVQKHPADFKCPECGDNDCLVDKHGNKYPCLSCIQIDIGQKLSKVIGEKFSKTVDKNNELIKSLLELFKGKR